MITLLRSGHYKLIETRRQIKILYLDGKAYAWIETSPFGEMLVASYKIHKTDCLLATGRFHLYNAQDEPALSDHIHLELEAGDSQWQGYLLLSGLPTAHKKRGRIIPTSETITNNPSYGVQEERPVSLIHSSKKEGARL